MHNSYAAAASIQRNIPGVSVKEVLGEGNFGLVHKAIMRIRGIDQFVAIKSYDLKQLNHGMTLSAKMKLLEKLEEEIKSLKELRHSAILKLFGDYEDPQDQYRHIILDFCDGGDLENDLFKQQKVFSEQQVKEWFRHLLDGLIEMEQKKIIHRDIKPANIFLKRGKVVLGDFGLAKNDFKYRAMTVAGSGFFQAPEISQRLGHTCKADVWSLGVTLYMLLFGRDPWFLWDGLQKKDGPSKNDVTESQCGNNLKFPYDSTISNELKHILKRMITWDQYSRISWMEILCDNYFDGPAARLRNTQQTVVDPVRAQSAELNKTKIIDSSYPTGPQNVQQVQHPVNYGIQQQGPLVNAQQQVQPTVRNPIQPLKQVVSVTPDQYFAYLNNCGKFFQQTGEALRYCSAKINVYHHDMWQYLGALGAVVNKVNIELLQMALEQINTHQQPKGIGTSFAPFYLNAQNLSTLKAKFEERLAKVQQLQTESLDWVQTRYKHPDGAALVQHLTLGPAFTSSKPANQLANKVAHVLCETAQRLHKEQQLRDDTFFQLKQGVCRVHLCLTYQQAMEFRDQQKEPLNWAGFLARLENPQEIDVLFTSSVQHFAANGGSN